MRHSWQNADDTASSPYPRKSHRWVPIARLGCGPRGSLLGLYCCLPHLVCCKSRQSPLPAPGWKVSLSRILIPLLTLALVSGAAGLQTKVAAIHAERIIAACEEFRVVSGRYPRALGQLVPRYLNSIPRAKYSLMAGDFVYWSLDGKPQLMWMATPVPAGLHVYDFERRKWSSSRD